MLPCHVKVEFGVLEEWPDGAGDDALEAADGFSFGLALAGASSEVVLGGRAAALAGDATK